MRLLQETEHDYAALVPAGAEARRLETSLERADRQATEREADSAALLIRQMRKLVAGVAARLPSPSDKPDRDVGGSVALWKLLGNLSTHGSCHSRLSIFRSFRRGTQEP